MEEDAVRFRDKVITQPCGSLMVPFSPTNSFPLLAPISSGPNMTHQDLQVVLMSLYMYEAAVRDAAEAERQAMLQAAAEAAAQSIPAPTLTEG